MRFKSVDLFLMKLVKYGQHFTNFIKNRSTDFNRIAFERPELYILLPVVSVPVPSDRPQYCLQCCLVHSTGEAAALAVYSTLTYNHPYISGSYHSTLFFFHCHNNPDKNSHYVLLLKISMCV